MPTGPRILAELFDNYLNDHRIGLRGLRVKTMSTFATPNGVRPIRLHSYGVLLNDDSDYDDGQSDGVVSDGDEDVPISELLDRNIGIIRSSTVITARHPGARDDEVILIIKNPTASKMTYKLLHPSTYCNVKDLGDMSQLALLLDAPVNWKELHDPLVVENSIVRIAFNNLVSLPDNAEESAISLCFALLIDRASIMLGIDVKHKAETKVIVGGLLALGECDVRSQTDMHILQNGRNVIATEIKTDKTFRQSEVWYRKSRGVQLLTAMYAHNAPTFLFTQKHWKLFVQKRDRSGVLTFPYDNIMGASPRQNSILMKPMGPTFLQAITICLLSRLGSGSVDAAHPVSASEAIPFTSPEPSRARNTGERLQYPSKSARRSEADTPASGMGGGSDIPRFKTGCREGKDIYSYIRVTPVDVVQKIEEDISAEEKARMDVRRAVQLP